MSVSYESFAPRSLSQRERLSRLEALFGDPYGHDDNDEENKTEEEDVMGCLLQSMSLTCQQEEDQKEKQQEWRKVAYEKANRLSDLYKCQREVVQKLEVVCDVSKDIFQRHLELLQQSGELSLAAERLQAEEICLENKAAQLGEPLLHYDALDRISRELGVEFSSGKVYYRHVYLSPDLFQPTLASLQAAIPYFKSVENEEYQHRALVLRDYTLDKIKEGIIPRLQQITLMENKNKIKMTADQLEASVLYTRFSGISSRCRSLLQVLSSFITGREEDDDDEDDNVYQELWNTCRNTYCTIRKKVLVQLIQAHLDKLRDEHGLVGMTRLASVFLLRICSLETNLYLEFFGSTDDQQSAAVQILREDGKDFKDAEFQLYLDDLCWTLYKSVRRGLVSLLDLDTLCQVVSVLREERTLANASPVTMAAARSISHCTRDAQERLIFCANTTLTTHVYKYKPTPADLNYPTILLEKKKEVYDSWFPPIRMVLKVLSKIFRVVEPRVFDDIALSSIQACIETLQNGAHTIHQTKSKKKDPSAQLHADLFLILHLLLLREQLSPFDRIITTSVQKQLDFRHAGKAVTKFLANRNRQLFQLHQDNALLTLLREGMTIQESSVDGRQELEQALKSACHDFMDHTSRQMAQPLFVLLDQYKNTDTAPEEAMVKSTVQQVQDRLEPTLGEIVTQMTLYMDNPGTRQVLYRPVLRKLTRLFHELQRKPHVPSLQEMEQILHQASTTLTTTSEQQQQ